MAAINSETVSYAKFVSAMREVAASVAVVTTDGVAGRHGATVTAVASVSADPPTILVCLHSQSRIAERVALNKSYCVNFLPGEAIEIADRFAGRDDYRVDDRFFGIACGGLEDGFPIIDGATALCCNLDQVLEAGTHLIFTGIVTNVQIAALDPLAYRDGAYHRVIPRQTGACNQTDFSPCRDGL